MRQMTHVNHHHSSNNTHNKSLHVSPVTSNKCKAVLCTYKQRAHVGSSRQLKVVEVALPQSHTDAVEASLQINRE